MKSKENVEEVYELIKKKVETYDPNKKVESEFGTTEAMGFWDLVGRNADPCDKFTFFIGCASAMLFGACLPMFCLLFGNMIDDVGSGGFESLQTQAKIMIFIGFGVFVVSGLMTTVFSLFAEKTIFKTKI